GPDRVGEGSVHRQPPRPLYQDKTAREQGGHCDRWTNQTQPRWEPLANDAGQAERAAKASAAGNRPGGPCGCRSKGNAVEVRARGEAATAPPSRVDGITQATGARVTYRPCPSTEC